MESACDSLEIGDSDAVTAIALPGSARPHHVATCSGDSQLRGINAEQSKTYLWFVVSQNDHWHHAARWYSIGLRLSHGA